MGYTTGYVAFIDILGFSNLVQKQSEFNSVSNLNKVIVGIRDVFNNNEKMNVKMAFFSDSIILSSSDYWDFQVPLELLEHLLRQETGLFFRGGIAYGEYFHEDNIAFGPALIEAHELEMRAGVSRIILKTQEKFEGELLFFEDIDGMLCWNPYASRLDHEFPSAIDYNDPIALREIDVVGLVIKSLKKIRKEIIESVLCYQTDDIGDNSNNNAKIINKYLWRIIPYNYTCDYFIQNHMEISYMKTSGRQLTEEEKEVFRELKLCPEEFVQGYAYL